MTDTVSFKKGNVIVSFGVMVVLFIGFFISESFYRASEAQDIAALKKQVAELSAQSTAINQLAADVAGINSRIVGKGPNGWHRPHAKVWAADLCARNKLDCKEITEGWPKF